MKKLPQSEVYERGLEYWPYKKSLDRVVDIICSQAPKEGSLVDLMCGPGYLLGNLAAQRKDLALLGVDIDQRFIDYSAEKYPEIRFQVGDVLEWNSKQLFDVVVCTGALHHLPYEKQAQAVARMASMVKPGGFCLISDAHIDDYSSERERKIAASKLGYEYLLETINNGASDDVVAWTVDILHNDVMMNEFKTSLKKRLPIYQEYFNEVELLKTWPQIDSQYGDYIMVGKSKKTSL